ncbi:MAG TPA: Ig-like domain-containing protein [Mobilitalea sp.]|nr:Ig-like domain-containing protein [Mobilitalea sp.]
MKKFISFILILALCIPLISPATASAATIKLNKTKLELHEGESYTLKLKGASGTVKWSTSKKSVATVSSSGKVKAVKEGKATITATYKNKTYKCAVTVISGKKADIILTAILIDNMSLEDYAANFYGSNLKILDIKKYDDEHIAVTIYETDRLQMVKEFKDNYKDFALSLISDDNLKDVFNDVKTDKLFKNIKLYTDKEVFENTPFASVYAMIYFGFASDIIQAINLIDPEDRKCNLTIIDNTTGEILLEF